MSEIEFEIDGQKLTAKPGQTIIEVADAAGIYIPRFCYHKHLSVAANCRMCLVEVEKAPKTLPACATPVAPGMKVLTTSEKTLASQRAVMEFLLVNHPLDCPICDQGGECELQDVSMGYGGDHSAYDEPKRAVADEDLGPLVATTMTRCILCTRCVRYGREVAGLPELGVVQRGEHQEIKTFVKQTLSSEVSGNIIDLCPVGALTAKPYRFTARAWEMQQMPSISPHDCLGTNMYVHTHQSKVKRVVARENQKINQTWLADRDRFSYTALTHTDRLAEPRIKQNGVWKNVSWQEALEFASVGLRKQIALHGAEQFASLASSSATTEEYYLLQKLTRDLGSPHIDFRLKEVDTQDQNEMSVFPGMEGSLDDWSNADAFLLIGSNIQREQPLAGLRIREAVKKGAKVASISSVDHAFNFKVTASEIVAPHEVLSSVAKIVEALQPGSFSQVVIDEPAKAISEVLKNKERIYIVLGEEARNSTSASGLRYLAQRIAKLSDAKLCLMTEGANSAGAWLAGAVPHRQAAGISLEKPGMTANELFSDPRKAYLLLNLEPEFDTANAIQALSALKAAEFVVAIATYQSQAVNEHADVVLPMSAFTETAGSYVNVAGDWQTFKGVVAPYGESRPAWKILRVLANFLEVSGFEYESWDEVHHELKQQVNTMPVREMHLQQPPQFDLGATAGLSRIGEMPIYAIDQWVRRSEPLQTVQHHMMGQVKNARMHPETAAQHGLSDQQKILVKQQDQSTELLLELDNKIAKNAVWLAGGVLHSTSLGGLYANVEVSAC